MEAKEREKKMRGWKQDRRDAVLLALKFGEGDPEPRNASGP